MIYLPNRGMPQVAIRLRGGWQRSLTAYVDDNRALRFGRLVIPLYAHQIAAQPQNWLQVEVGYFDAGRMLAYCRNRNWTWYGGVDSPKAAFTDTR